MRKLLSVLLLALLMALPLMASGQGDGEKAQATGGKVLWVLWDNPETSGQNKVAEMFIADNPTIDVEVMQIPYAKYEDKVRTLLAAGDAPDIAQVNDDFVVTYTKRNLILPLTAYVENSKNLDPDDLYKRIWDFNWYEGEMMALSPFNKVRLMYYNKDLLDAAGLSEPPADWGNVDWDWDMLLEYAQKTTDASKNQWGTSIIADTASEQIYAAANQGHGLFSKDGQELAAAWPEGVEALQFLGDLTHKYKVQPTWGERANTQAMFLAGNIAVFESGAWVIPQVRESAKFQWNLAPMPIAPGKPQFANHEGSLVCYAIPKRSENADLAWKVIEYLTTENAQKIFAAAGFVPTHKAYAAKYYVNPDLMPSRQMVAVNGMDFHQSVNFTEQTDEGKKRFRVWLHQVWTGEMSAADAMVEAKKDVEEILTKK